MTLENLNSQPAPSAPFVRLRDRLDAAKAKIQEEVFRFRTCCADPRASK